MMRPEARARGAAQLRAGSLSIGKALLCFARSADALVPPASLYGGWGGLHHLLNRQHFRNEEDLEGGHNRRHLTRA